MKASKVSAPTLTLRKTLVIAMPLVLALSFIALALAAGCESSGKDEGAASVGPGSAQPLAITTTSLPLGSVAQSYSTALAASGGRAPLVWSFAAIGSLPSGATLSSDGMLEWGTPIRGSYLFDVRVSDADGASDVRSLSLAVIDAANPHAAILLAAGRDVESSHFATSSVCADCHSNHASSTAMRDAAANPIAPYDLWQSSMMANATRDPFFRAVMSAEIAAFPALQSTLEEKCLTCHAPMTARESGLSGTVFPTLDSIASDTESAQLSLDGVSCTVCHQIQPANLGSESSFGGGFEIGRGKTIFGPHTGLFAMPMQNRSGFTPTQGSHIRESSLCATCHTLETPSVATDGTIGGTQLPEQMPYLEWRNSIYNTEGPSPSAEAASCQSCHVPRTDAAGNAISTRVARRPDGTDFPPISSRDFGRHLFVGGNTFMLKMLRDNASELSPRASMSAFNATIAATESQLQNATAALTLSAPARSGDALSFDVSIENLTGHKFPTGYPSRRAWLEVEVFDSTDASVFHSGAFDAQGRILDSSGAVQSFEEVGGELAIHRDQISDPNHVVIYEALMQNDHSALTSRLLRGFTYRKDNRLLPKGWSTSFADLSRVRAIGTDGDANFKGGGDSVSFSVSAPASRGPYTIRARLHYQTLSARFAAELFAWNTAEVASFKRYFDAADKTPELIAEASASE